MVSYPGMSILAPYRESSPAVATASPPPTASLINPRLTATRIMVFSGSDLDHVVLALHQPSLADPYFQPVLVEPKRGILLTALQREIIFSMYAQDVLADLGPPDRIVPKGSNAMRAATTGTSATPALPPLHPHAPRSSSSSSTPVRGNPEGASRVGAAIAAAAASALTPSPGVAAKKPSTSVAPPASPYLTFSSPRMSPAGPIPHGGASAVLSGPAMSPLALDAAVVPAAALAAAVDMNNSYADDSTQAFDWISCVVTMLIGMDMYVRVCSY